MTNDVPDVHANDRDIPPGKVLLCEYRDIPADAPRARPITLETRLNAWVETTGRGVTVDLIAIPAGWAIAGSCARWDNGCFGYSWCAPDGTTHGRRFKTYDEARAAFDAIPA